MPISLLTMEIGLIKYCAENEILDNTVLGGPFRQKTLEYLETSNLNTDIEGKDNDYDLVFTCSDLIIQKNIIGKKIVLIQEGMTDPENILFHLVKKLNLPGWIAGTSTTGLSDAYLKFCVASEGYKNFFIKKGAKAEKLEVTGIPNFDNCKSYLRNNSFPHKNYVLVATSDCRETFKYENRKEFTLTAREAAAAVIFGWSSTVTRTSSRTWRSAASSPGSGTRSPRPAISTWIHDSAISPRRLGAVHAAGHTVQRARDVPAHDQPGMHDQVDVGLVPVPVPWSPNRPGTACRP